MKRHLVLAVVIVFAWAAAGLAIVNFSEREYQALKQLALSIWPYGDTLPLSPRMGQIHYLTNDDGTCAEGSGAQTTPCRWDGSDWISVGGAAPAVPASWPSDNVAGGITWAGAIATAAKIGTTNYWAIGNDPTDGLYINCVVAGVENDCNYTRKLASGKYFGITNAGGTSIFKILQTGEINDVSLSVEGSGNSVTIKRYLWRPFAACQAGGPSTIWNLPSSNAPVPACKGSNATRGVLEFADGATDLATTIEEFLNEDWVGAIDATILWESASTSTNNVLWGIAIACAAVGESSDPAFTDDDFTADANNGTANTYNSTAVNTVTTTGTCAAGEMMHIRVKRRLSQAGDTLAATAQAVGLALKLREAQ